jgi:hypothetical protein
MGLGVRRARWRRGEGALGCFGMYMSCSLPSRGATRADARRVGTTRLTASDALLLDQPACRSAPRVYASAPGQEQARGAQLQPSAAPLSGACAQTTRSSHTSSIAYTCGFRRVTHRSTGAREIFPPQSTHPRSNCDGGRYWPRAPSAPNAALSCSANGQLAARSPPPAREQPPRTLHRGLNRCSDPSATPSASPRRPPPFALQATRTAAPVSALGPARPTGPAAGVAD